MTQNASPPKLASGRLNTVGIDNVISNPPADHPHALLDEIDRGPRQFQPVIAALVAFQHEATILPQQHAGFVDRHFVQRVASIARAATSGSSAAVIGRPMTRIEAP